MPTYYARIQLHGAPRDYDVLHGVMEEIGWSKIVEVNGVYKGLPTGTYRGEFLGDKVAVFSTVEKAVDAARISSPRASIIVIKSDGTWSRLEDA